MSSNGKRVSVVNTGPQDFEINGDKLENQLAGPVDVLLRIVEVTGVPSPTAGVATDVYWQLDLGLKRVTGIHAPIVGVAESPSLPSVPFNEDYIIKRASGADMVLLTLRSSALGNGCFAKLMVDVEKEFVKGRTGAPGESLVVGELELTPAFKSNNPQVQYSIKVKFVAKSVIAKEQIGQNLIVLPNQSFYILPDPKGTLPGVPITSLLFLHRTANPDKIAKGSILLDTLGESKVLIDGKLGKRRSFWSSGETFSVVYPGVAAALDSESGLMERAAQDFIQKTQAAQGGSSAPPATTTNLAELSRAPRASQRASMLFRGAPKITEWDNTATTYAWRLTIPVPNVVPVAGKETAKTPLPASVSFANDGSDIFDLELSKNSSVAFGVRHAINIRCGLTLPAQTPFIVHAPELSNTTPVSLTSSDNSVSLKALLTIDTSTGPDGAQRKLELTVKANSTVNSIVCTVYGQVAPAGNPNNATEWKALEHTFAVNSDSATVSKTLTSAVYGPPTSASNFESSYLVEATVSTKNGGDVKFAKIGLPVKLILAPELASMDTGALKGQELDTLQMRSALLDRPDVVVIPPIYPTDAVTVYSKDGTPLSFEDVAGPSGNTAKPSKPNKGVALPVMASEAPPPRKAASPGSGKRKSGKNQEADAIGDATPSSPGSSKRKSKKTEPVQALEAAY